MKRLRAIDPSKGLAYCADFDLLDLHDGRLLDVNTEDLQYCSSDTLAGIRLDVLIVERPLIRPRSKVNPNDIVDLAWCAAVMFERFRPRNAANACFYRPEEWKGQIPKPVHHMNVLDALTAEELEVLPHDVREVVERAANKGMRDGWKAGKNYYREKDTVHNTLDAVGLGLTVLGRLPFPVGYRAKPLPALVV